MSSTYDYIIIGGGVAGLTLAARLSQLLPPSETKQILVLEAGTDPSRSDYILSATGYNRARESEHAYILDVIANPHLNGRTAKVSVGKALSGSGAINGSAWTRGPKVDYDYWAKVVGDDAWSYDELVPFFRKTEWVVEPEAGTLEEEGHGHNGTFKVVPIRANHPRRQYPLRETIQKAWDEAGVPYNPDGNSGDQNGLTEMVELWVDGQRQLPSETLDLSRVEIRERSVVRRITFDLSTGGEPVANGVELSGAQHFAARREVILCAGVYQSPQVLMLSGIGDREVLQKHNIHPVVTSNAEVGKNLVDHLAVGMTWKLKHPEEGLAIGSPLFNDPSYFTGWPLDFIEFGPLDRPAELEPLIQSAEDREFLLRPDASHMEIVTLYVPMGARLTGIDAAIDGSHISTIAVCLATTSKGCVTIQSANPEVPPVIDTNFNATETDRYISREALRKAASVYLDTETGKSFISHEVVPEGYVPISRDTPDEAVDKRVRDFGYSLDHPMGTCSMGKVVDSHCRVVGVKGLRVVDASVIPIPLSCHIQAAVYALAERVAVWVANGE